MRKKRAFTLLEIIIVIAILAGVSSIIGVQGNSLIGQYRFKMGIEKLFSQMCEMQSHAMNYQNSIELHLSREGKEWHYRFFTEQPIRGRNKWGNHLLKNTYSLLQNGDEKKENLSFVIDSTGYISPPSLLQFSDGAYSVWIDLTHPPQLSLMNKLPLQQEKSRELKQIGYLKELIRSYSNKSDISTDLIDK